MKVVSVINYKGGVGKTTVTSNIGAELAFRGLKVLVIDLDPQTNLTFSFIRPDEWQADYADDKTIKKIFDSFVDGENYDINRLIFSPSRVASALSGNGKLSLISSHLGLINVDLELATLLGGANMKQTKNNFLKVHRRLVESLNEIDENEFDVVIIDCPPNFNIVTKNAIVASDYVLVPTRPDFLSTLGIDYLIRSMNELIEDYNEFSGAEDTEFEEIEPATIGVLFTMIQERSEEPINAQSAYIRQIQRQGGLHVFENYIKRNDTLFASAPESGVPVVLRPQSQSTYKNVVKGLEKVAEEFAQLIDLEV
ncbi:ParA family protein [Jiella mangrovi]|uniref:AAA family ATPase n=1 Tax=Jiella mangrovi TaxID=2821407 RepID=A0ABS4BLL8_9HYPH|nr:AAA family ATPase [Jiella mangrovi]MBP0617045.1 AAA family ATPase [Jiella mangrovi]